MTEDLKQMLDSVASPVSEAKVGQTFASADEGLETVC